MIAAGALVGLRVIDLTQALAGPFCTMLLADLGADVIKVEPPGGDPTRALGPYAPDDTMHAFGGAFQSANRNKRSIAVDLRHPEGVEVLRRLLKGAHVLVENFRVGVMERLGLSYESLAKDYPRLVYACVRGFGDPRTGVSPYVDWPAYDIVAQAMGGVMGITGPGPEQPVKAGPAVGDLVPAMLLAVGILAAVRHAEATGRGQFVDVAMYDGILALCQRPLYQYSFMNEIAGPDGNKEPFMSPFDAFPVRDGWVAIAAPMDHLWQKLCEVIGQPELGKDQRFATNGRRWRNSAEVGRIIREWTSVRTRREVIDALSGIVPCGPVNNMRDIFEDPHVRERAMMATVEHPGLSRPVTIAACPIKMTVTPTQVRTRAPLLGEHTELMLGEIGYSKEEIEALIKSGVVATPASLPNRRPPRPT